MFHMLRNRTHLMTSHVFSKVTKTMETQGERLCLEERSGGLVESRGVSQTADGDRPSLHRHLRGRVGRLTASGFHSDDDHAHGASGEGPRPLVRSALATPALLQLLTCVFSKYCGTFEKSRREKVKRSQEPSLSPE